MTPDLLFRLNVVRRERKPAVVIKDLDTGEARLVIEGERVDSALGSAVGAALRSGKSTTIEMDGRHYFLNVHLPPARIVIIGAVHISQALAPMASLAGFDVTVIDPRTAFATEERFSGVRLVAEWPEEVLAKEMLDPFTALAAVTHDPKIDDYPLSAALAAGCFYVGALGSRKTHGRRIERLVDSGVERQQVERIAAPIGLDIGAATPAEIAVAVLAEIVAALRRREIGGITQPVDV